MGDEDPVRRTFLQSRGPTRQPTLLRSSAPWPRTGPPLFSLLNNRRSLAGRLVGSIEETQEMLDFCAQNGITSLVEVVRADEIDAAYDRVAAGDVRYRCVIDMATMATG